MKIWIGYIGFLVCLGISVSAVPSPLSGKMYRGMPDEEMPADPDILQKMEEFRMNMTSPDKGRNSLLSCLEDQTYSAINDFANCHLFCPMCNQGYGRCESTGSMRICICDCNFLSSIPSIMPEKECPLYNNLCTRTAETALQARKLTACQEECQARQFQDGALCGAEMEDPPLLRSTCTCLC